ncbi:MAG TPA: HAD-IIA family hydrolase [Thermoleophilaceae bacterium]|nr:HAD-IIA family hydrolase [Thermoleophilaceae bacterium]
MPLSPIAQRYDQFILDLDGCVWVGDEATPRAVEAIDALRDAGKQVAYATNDPRSATEDYVARLWKVGIRASVRDVVTVGGAMQHLLAETRSGMTAFVIGTDALRRHVAEAGLRVLNGTDLASRAEVVIVGGTEDLVYADLREAALAVRRGADFLATARDPTYPQPDGLWPGTGAILAAVEVASGRTADVVGKPEPQLFYTALDRLGAGTEGTLAVGDRVDTDLSAAAAAELDAALVLSGGTERQALNGFEPQPVAVTDTLADLILA